MGTAPNNSPANPAEQGQTPAPVTIKKYANRRLYNTATSSYVTLDTLAQMVKSGEEFSVFDAKSGDDITRSVLTQIIFEEEAKGENLLPIKFLRQLIGFYGNGMQGFVPGYLEMSLENLTKQQKEIGRAFGGEAALQAMQTMTEKNAEIFRNAMQVFQPFGAAPVPFGATPDKSATKPAEPEDGDARESELKDMRAQLDEMRGMLEAMGKKD